MKCFQTIQENIKAMGLVPSQQPNNGPQWNSRQIICTAIYTVDAMTMVAYVFYEVWIGFVINLAVALLL